MVTYLADSQGKFYTELYSIMQDTVATKWYKAHRNAVSPFTVDGEILLTSIKSPWNSLKSKLPLHHCFLFLLAIIPLISQYLLSSTINQNFLELLILS